MAQAARRSPEIQAFLAKHFARYYATGQVSVDAVEQREWMRVELNNHVARPLFFANDEELRRSVAAEPPLGLFYSVGLYPGSGASTSPRVLTRPPELADAAIDIDCKPGPPPDGDGFADFDDAWLAARSHTQRVVGDLRRDFAVQADELQLRFSGSKGYHVLLTGPRIRRFVRQARAELASCLTGADTKLGLLFPGIGGIQLPRLAPSGGAARRIWDSLAALHTASRLPVMPERLRALVAHHCASLGGEAVLKGLRDANDLGDLLRRQPKWWEPLSDAARHFAGPLIDTAVLVDMRRLIRAPGSINGKSGLLCCTIPADRLAQFNPIRDANPHDRHESVPVRGLQEARLQVGGESFTIQVGQRLTVPATVGVPWVARGVAEPCP